MKKLTLLIICSLMAFQVKAQLPWPAESLNPDSYGYTYKTNDATNGPAYSWVEIITNNLGTEVMGLADDNIVGPINMGIEFPYYWNTKTEIFIGSNGYLSMGTATNIASTAIGFPPTPTASNPNDVLAPFMSDLSFVGPGNPGRVFTYNDVANDRFIVTYDAVPYWTNENPNDWQGSNTFQVILDASDSTITYQYQSMIGNWNSGYDDSQFPFVTGIENVSGTIGMLAPELPVNASKKPVGNTAIQFKAPAVALIDITDVGITSVQNKENGGFFVPRGNLSFPLRTFVENTGNTDITADIQITGLISDTTGSLVWTDQYTIVGGLPQGQGEEVTFAIPFNPPTTGSHNFSVRVQNPVTVGDINTTNDVRLVEAVVLDTTQQEVRFSYVSDNFLGALATSDIVSWSGNNDDSGIGVAFESYGFPIDIIALEYLLLNGQGTMPTEGFIASLYGASTNGTVPGPLLFSDTLDISEVVLGGPNPQTMEDGWTRVDLPTPIRIDSGEFYVEWIQVDNDIVIFLETLAPISRRTYEVLSNTWATYRENTINDPYIRAVVKIDSAVTTAIGDPIEDVLTFNAFPNPTSGNIQVDIQLRSAADVELKLYDMQGRKIMRQVLPNAVQVSETIDMSQLTAGIYTLHMSMPDGSVRTQKVILR
ncbi:MAG: T9SS type A sorting domain-containing protein [Bacteroidota bacterium]